jgi:uncharacterized SAM-binding protein YcdF (DUF218 family)
MGTLLGFEVMELGLTGLLHFEYSLLLFGILGAVVAFTPARKWLLVACASLLLVLSALAYTPVVSVLIRQVIRSDALRPSPAIVVLSSTIQTDKSLSASAQERVMQGYLLLRRGYARELVLTDAVAPFGTQAPTVRQQMKGLGLSYPVDQVGPVRDTHDEAIAVARLARARGWRQVILVTHPWHMRRAAAVFETAGVSVLCSPCVEGRYDLGKLDTPPGRLYAFRDWLHETVGYWVYRWRGWIA